VHATRPIAADEEITISYSNPFHPTSARQQHLQDAFHFNCRCPRCTSGDTSDAILDEITALQQVLGDWETSSVGIATPEKAERLVNLYKQDGLDGFLDAAYGYAALTYNAVGDAEQARQYAGLAAESVIMRYGRAAIDLGMWKEVEEWPEGHWSWMWRRR